MPKTKSRWNRKSCGCIKATLAVGRVIIRCEKHLGKPSSSGRLGCYLDDDGIVRRG